MSAIQYSHLFPNLSSTDVVSNSDTTHLIVNMNWEYVVDVEMGSAMPETGKRHPRVINVAGVMRHGEQIVRKRKKENESHEDEVQEKAKTRGGS